MAGELSRANVEAAARAGAMQAEALRRIEDGFSPDPQLGLTLDNFQRMLDEAGHAIGEGYDDCAVCQQTAAMAPMLIQQLMATQQEQQAGFSA